jgi:uncharacterized DUF497 family protein
MAIIWDNAKAARLLETRQISLVEIADLLLERRYLAILENPSHPEQMVFVLPYKNYTHVVPFVVDEENNIILRTAFPSRKFHKIYGKGKDESEA